MKKKTFAVVDKFFSVSSYGEVVLIKMMKAQLLSREEYFMSE